MCGCEAHHTKGAGCTCPCPPRHHADPADVALTQQMPWWLSRFGVPEDEPVPPRWARRLGLQFHSDDDSILVRHFYGNQVSNRKAGTYVSDEVVLSYTSFSWALGVEYENQEIDPQREVWWRGLTLRVGPFSLTASRDKGKF